VHVEDHCKREAQEQQSEIHTGASLWLSSGGCLPARKIGTSASFL
jgi:hypothetical protein